MAPFPGHHPGRHPQKAPLLPVPRSAQRYNLAACCDMRLLMHFIEHLCPAAGEAAANAKPRDLGHILAGIPGNLPASAAEVESANSGRPALLDPFSEPATTPSKAINSSAKGATKGHLPDVSMATHIEIDCSDGATSSLKPFIPTECALDVMTGAAG